MTEVKTRKKLIEVALPLLGINAAAAHEKQPGIGAHPRGLHLWWARRPLATARAVIFAQLVDDPSSHPERFPTASEQDAERRRLFGIIENLVIWGNTANRAVLEQAHAEIWRSWRWTCEDNRSHPRASELFDPDRLPAFHDPFAGGGSLPLEAQRLGLEAHASDLNPVAVLINKAMIEIPPKFAGLAPVNPDSRSDNALLQRQWSGAEGLADDVRYYGGWMRAEAEKRIGHLYPRVTVTDDMVSERPDLSGYRGRELAVIAWIWARTVTSPNPAFAGIQVPLATTFMLATKKGREAWVEPVVEGGDYRFTVRVGPPDDLKAVKAGTKLGAGSNFECLLSGTPIDGDYIKIEGQAGRIGARLLAIVAKGDRGRVYLSPTQEHDEIGSDATSEWRPEVEFFAKALGFRLGNYGMSMWSHLFTARQLAALSSFSGLVLEAIEQAKRDAAEIETLDVGESLSDGGDGATAYGEAVGVYLAFAVDRLADYNSTISTWKPSGEQVMQTYKRQALPMTWDFPESNILGTSAICWSKAVKYSADNLTSSGSVMGSPPGFSDLADAGGQVLSRGKIVSTDPPYYDNIGYADLSDFFYVWLRRSLGPVFPGLFATLAVPKGEELVATPHRHGGKDEAEQFFLHGMTRAIRRLAEESHPAFPVTIYYAFKQSETGKSGTASTGWETFLDAVIRAGFGISGTWPMRTELANRMRGMGSNALASSVVLVCRPQAQNGVATSRRDFLAALKQELPSAIAHLQLSNTAPVDLAQAAIGPGMAIYTRYGRVLESDGSPLGVRTALTLINEVLDEALAEQEGDFDADTRWALAWFEEHRFGEGDFGLAETLSKAKNTSVSGIVDSGILASRGGKVRLLMPAELPPAWDPATDDRIPAWEVVHHLIRVLETSGEDAAAELVTKLGGQAEVARELAYRLYTICERKKWAPEARAYNGLVVSWSEIEALAQKDIPTPTSQGQRELFDT